MEEHGYWTERLFRLNLGLPLFMSTFGTIIPNLCLLYVLFCTKYWYLPLLYLIWIFLIDRKACETGSRGFFWLRRVYFLSEHRLPFKTASAYKLDPNKNYLFCGFPHGLIPYGFLRIFGTNDEGFKNVFPAHSPYGTIAHSGFFTPIFREYLFAFNGCSVSEKSLDYLLNDSSGGKAVCLLVGGGDEIVFATEKDYHIVLRKRRGFVRVALKNGSPLVPVFSFGINNVYKYPQNQITRCLQRWIELFTRRKVVFFYGQGIFQDWFGFVPIIKSVTTIAGEPIEVVKTENPTNEDIDELHKKFTRALIKLFNEHKHKYLEEDIQLIIH